MRGWKSRQRKRRKRRLGWHKPRRRRYGSVGPSLVVAGFFFTSALALSYLLPTREESPPSFEPTASSTPAPSQESESTPDAALEPTHRAVRGAIERGQTFAQALVAQGVPRPMTHEIVSALRSRLNFRRINPGSTFRATLDSSGSLVHFQYDASPLEIYEITPNGTGYQVVRREIPVERRVETIGGTVTSSLFESVEALGEGPELTMRFIDIFLWDFDFNNNARPGDEFRMLVEKEYGGGTFVGYGKILIAQYENRGKTYTGVYFETPPGKGDFYTPDGRSVRKTFLRSPLRFTRISSRYTHRRHHPILGGVRPHLAIDYAAPVGTPVWSVADGVVLSVGWNGGNGKSILVQHRSGYQTMYNHLSGFARGIRRGIRVRQKQVIGYVGSTGLSTGPHLDYRVNKDGRFVDPLSQKFIPGDPIPKSQMDEFENLRDRLLHQLTDGRQAMTEQNE